MKSEHRNFKLGRVLPSLVLLFFSADVTLRMFPFETWRFNPHTVLVELNRGVGPFEPSAKYEGDVIGGDIANFANLPPIQPRGVATVQTDSLGFRNPPDLASFGEMDAILVGDSFAYGGDSYDKTLAAVISKECRLRLYNMAPYIHPRDVLGIAQHFRMTQGVVIYELLERGSALTIPEDIPQVSGPVEQRFLIRHSLTWLVPVVDQLRIAAVVSPLEVFSQRAYKRLENDLILPNAEAGKGIVAKLTNGETMYFYEPDVHPVRSPVQKWADFVRWMASVLRERNLDLLVVLVPNKYTVYAPLVAGQMSAGESQSRYIDSLANELESQHIVTVNLREALQTAAAERLKNNSYLFWLDDTHWNPNGMDVAAQEICEGLRRVGRHEGKR
jgi:hypothetical protein